jgi:hypothetical protein
VRPDRARFESRRTREAWQEAETRFDTQVLGPHFEGLSREWSARFASSSTLGGVARRVGFTQVNDPVMRTRFELDVVVEGPPRTGDRRPSLLAIGEAKGGPSRRSLDDLRRLERIRAQLANRAVVDRTRLLLFSRGGFAADLRAQARVRDDVELVDLDRLYGGD